LRLLNIRPTVIRVLAYPGQDDNMMMNNDELIASRPIMDVPVGPMRSVMT
jgi:hypothetical protein